MFDSAFQFQSCWQSFSFESHGSAVRGSGDPVFVDEERKWSRVSDFPYSTPIRPLPSGQRDHFPTTISGRN